jgi:serine/threonine-protein kinase
MTSDEPTVKRIGRYEVIRKIATGGMAELFLARFVGPGGFEKRCALKRILPQFAADQTFTRMFLNEARVTAMFDHPNLVQIFELGQDEQGQFYIAMELVNGINLRQLNTMCAEKGILIPPELAGFMVTQALDGLEYAHNFRDPDSGTPLGLVHRDISPQNILVSYEGAVKLVDFGIVKGSTISGETQAGMLKGKVAYMSPEQASGEPIDRRSDLFSLGVCFYELLVGERPFQGPNEIMTLKAILEEAPLPVTSFVPDCPIGIERSVYKSLEKYPEDRYQRAREFQLELQSVLKDCPTPLGRHVVAEFLQSLTEADTDSAFDSTKLKIPRYGVGFGQGNAKENDAAEVAPPSTVYVPQGAKQRPPVARKASNPRIPNRAPVQEHPYTPTPISEHPHVSTMDPIASEVSAAGLDKRFSAPVIGVFLASAFVGAIGVWWATKQRAEITIEPATPKVTLVAKQPAEPPAPPPPVQPPPPPIEAPPPAAPVVKETPKRKVARSKPRERRSHGPMGRVSITSVPRNLSVFLGKKKLGTTPLETKLPVGTHALTLSSKSLGIKRSLRIHVSEIGAAEEKVVIGRGMVRVVTRPWATVYVDGVEKGRTPIQFALYEGEHVVRLVSGEGSDERIFPIDVKAGAEEKLITVKF